MDYDKYYYNTRSCDSIINLINFKLKILKLYV